MKRRKGFESGYCSQDQIRETTKLNNFTVIYKELEMNSNPYDTI